MTDRGGARTSSQTILPGPGELGTVGPEPLREIIVTAEQVLAGLDAAWLERLRADVAGRTVVFVGYRGRDLDFQPVWDAVLGRAVSVVWFERWDGGKCFEEDHKRLLLRRADASGRLLFALPAAFRPSVPPAARPNPSWDFVAWCRDHQLAGVSPALARQLFDDLPAVRFPPLPGAPGWARPAVQGLLGDYKGARNSYLRTALRPCSQRKAAMLAPAAALPAWGRLGRAGELARRKRLAAWSHTARYEAVLRATRQLPADAVSTYLILRSQAQRVTGSLDEAAQTAATARIRARGEHHPVRTAHAAFQECLALLWAERLDEARSCLAEYLKPYAALAASRWVAWADFIAGGLAVREASADAAFASFLAAETRFRAEAPLDGVVSVKTARLGRAPAYLRCQRLHARTGRSESAQPQRRPWSAVLHAPEHLHRRVHRHRPCGIHPHPPTRPADRLAGV
jgi:hypothetical protein